MADKKSVVSETSSDTTEGTTSFFKEISDSTLEFWCELCTNLPVYVQNCLFILTFLFENIQMIVLCMDYTYPWGNETKRILHYFANLRGPLFLSFFEYQYGVFVNLIASLIITIFFFICYNVQRFGASKRTIKWVKVILMLLGGIGYLPFMSMLLFPMKCNYETNTLLGYPDIECFTVPNVIMIILSIVPTIALIGVSFFLKLLILERFQSSKCIGAGPDGRFIASLFIFRTVMMIANQMCGTKKGFPLFFGFVLLILLFIYFFRFIPYYRLSVCIAQIIMMSFWLGGLLASFFATIFPNKEFTALIFLSSIPIAIVSIILLYLRDLIWKAYVAVQLERAKDNCEAFEWMLPIDFDYAAITLDRESDKTLIYQIGFDKYKMSIRMRLFYVFYLFDTNCETQRHIIHTLLKNPLQKFIFIDTHFFYQFHQKKRHALDQSGNLKNLGLSYLLRKSKNYCAKIRRVMREFWEECLNENIDFSKFPAMMTTLVYLEKRVSEMLTEIISHEPYNISALRAMGEFEGEIRRNFLVAEIYFREADLAEDRQHRHLKKAKTSMKKFLKTLRHVALLKKDKKDIKIPEASLPYLEKEDQKPSYVIETEQKTPQTAIVDLEDDPNTDTEFKTLAKQQPDEAKSESNLSDTHWGRHSHDVEDGHEYTKILENIERSSSLSILCFKISMIIAVLLGVVIIGGAWVNSLGMVNRFDKVEQGIGKATDSRKLLMDIVLSAKKMQLSVLNSTLFEFGGNITHHRLAFRRAYEALETTVNALYRDSNDYEALADFWHSQNTITLQRFYKDETTTMEMGLLDAFRYTLTKCESLINIDDSEFENGNIFSNLDFKFIIVNCPTALLNGLHKFVEVVLKNEIDYKNDFIVAAFTIPILFIIPFLIVLPSIFCIYLEQRNAFKYIQLLDKSVIGSIYQGFLSKKEDVRLRYLTSTFRTTIWKFIMISIVHLILVITISGLGIFASSEFLARNAEVDAINNLDLRIYALQHFAIEMIYSNFSFYSKEEWLNQTEEEINTILYYDAAVRYGSPEMGTRGIQTNEDLYKLFYEKTCNEIGNEACWGIHQLLFNYIEATRRTITNATEDSVHFEKMNSLINGPLSAKMNIAVRMIAQTSTPSEFQKELNRLKKMFLIVPHKSIKANEKIENFLNGKQTLVERHIREYRKIREGRMCKVLDNSCDAIVEFNEEAIISHLNGAAEEMFMCKSDVMKGVPFKNLFVQSTLNEFMTWFQQRIKTNAIQKPFQGDLEAVCQNEEAATFPVRITVSYSKEKFGSYLFIAFIRNISAEKKQKELLLTEKKYSQELLWNILPKKIAALKMQAAEKDKNKIIVNAHDEVTILFADIVGFTSMSDKMSPEELVTMLNTIFSTFDQLAAKYHLEKIKTIGDCYFVACGVPEYNVNHAIHIMEFAIECQTFIKEYNANSPNIINMRFGINTGPVVAGVIGQSKYCYDLWGDAVNIASRMESTAEPGTIQVSRSTYVFLYKKYNFKEREVEVKGKGKMTVYVFESKKSDLTYEPNLETVNTS